MTTACNRRAGGDARGFTLFEVVLATVLAATLLLGLWSLFSVYTRLFEAGKAKTEIAQLARALLDQIAADLASAIQDPIPAAASKARTSTPLRRFTLFGSSRELRLDVLQLTPLEGNPTPVSDFEQGLSEPSAARVPELRTVYYTFQGPLVSGDSVAVDATAENLPGLTRRELDFETPVTDEPVGNLPGDTPLDDAGAPGSVLPMAVDDSVLRVPEVVGLNFRYFDGSSWSGEWNSLTRKSLPVAVEVTIQLGATSAPEPRPAVESEEGSEGLDTGLEGVAGGPTYRLVVDLPGSPTHGAPRRDSPVVERRSPRPVIRRAPPPRRPAAPAAQPLSDEWMRTQP